MEAICFDKLTNKVSQVSMNKKKVGVRIKPTIKDISKCKGFKKTRDLNEETGRFNQCLQCLTCNKKF